MNKPTLFHDIDDDISAKELADNQLLQERCIQVSPKGAGALKEVREGLERLRYDEIEARLRSVSKGRA